ncbi:putative ABC transport system permease protein [Lachnospiraceae bacterium PF1-22]|uniref:ABC transporter permease n=1 Tax=Ohessyouella blattaphilus TaxID=2949333 RepID=UPI003E1B5B73
MTGRIIRKDLARNKIVTLTLFCFILIASLLVSGAVRIVTEMTGAVDALFSQAAAPDFIQMHTGDVDQGAIDRFAEQTSMVTSQQTVEMLNIDNANLAFAGRQPATNSVMENGFVRQNEEFDFLLDLDNQVVRPKDGEIAVPIYYLQRDDLAIGDTLEVVDGQYRKEFRIIAFVRDAQMNPSLISSKRFVVSEADFTELRAHTGSEEYLIEFQLAEGVDVGEFERVYQSAGLPQKDTAITAGLLKLMNALTDGLVAALVILVSLLIITVALLCLRLTLLANMEEDTREIGVMKAIGIKSKDIRGLYLLKYRVMAGLACLLGFVLSLPLGKVFTANITLYMGKVEVSPLTIILPVLGTVAVYGIVMMFCRLVLRRFRRISAVEALRAGGSASGKLRAGFWPLYKRPMRWLNLRLGAREVLRSFGSYGLLCFVFILCVFLFIVPINLLTTVQAPNFINYMGMGQSDVQIDLRRTEGVEQRYTEMLKALSSDEDVEHFAPYVTAAYPLVTDGETSTLRNVQIGDFSQYAIDYLDGKAPQTENEIALSQLNAQDLEVAVGDSLTLLVEDRPRTLTVSGIYQDLTNGGRTAKASLPWRAEDVQWYLVYLDLNEGIDRTEKVAEYAEVFAPAKVTHIDSYIAQTFGSTISQLRMVVVLAALLSAAVAVLITALFLRMLTAKEAHELSILTFLGFQRKDLARQYTFRTLLVLVVGVVIGTLAAATLGQNLAGLMFASMGASRIRFVVQPVVVYLLCPLILAGVVALTTLASTRMTGRIKIQNLVIE